MNRGKKYTVLNRNSRNFALIIWMCGFAVKVQPLLTAGSNPAASAMPGEGYVVIFQEPEIVLICGKVRKANL